MKILDALIESLTEKDMDVKNVLCGAFWTAVTTRRTGLATTYRVDDCQHSDEPWMVPDAGSLTEKTAGA